MTDALDALMAVMDEAFDPHWREAWTRRQVEDSLLLSSTYMLLSGPDGRPWNEGEEASGFVLARHAPGEDELLLIAVRSDCRGRGIGQRLLTRFFAEAADRGSDSVFLEMRDNNPAEHLYARAGFAPIGRRKAYYRTLTGETLDAITFGKSLHRN